MDIEGSEIEILNKIIDLNMHDKIKYIFVETHERFSHKLGLETAKLKLRIKNLNINNLIYRLEPNDKELRILASIISSLTKKSL